MESSELVSTLLDQVNIPHKVLNAKHNEAEAAVVALAGRKGAVTVATNMAGRGTDIMLGGNVEFLLMQKLKAQDILQKTLQKSMSAYGPAALDEMKQQAKDEPEEVKNWAVCMCSVLNVMNSPY